MLEPGLHQPGRGRRAVLVHPHAAEAEHRLGHGRHIADPFGLLVGGFEPLPSALQVAIVVLRADPVGDERLGVLPAAHRSNITTHLANTPRSLIRGYRSAWFNDYRR